MGLDQYLKARVYVPNYVAGMPFESGNPQLTAIREALAVPLEIFTSGAYVEFDVMYWRKANHIHNWFESNLASVKEKGGNLENVTEYEVTREELTELRDVCTEVLIGVEWSEPIERHSESGASWVERKLEKCDADVALDLLPPQQGFFFGGTDVDDWYYEDVEATLKMIERVLVEPSVAGASFTYRGWW